MNTLLETALGPVTGIGGFLEAASVAISTQAGAAFGFQLAWAIAVGTLWIAFRPFPCHWFDWSDPDRPSLSAEAKGA